MSFWTHVNIEMYIDAKEITEEEIKTLLGTPYEWEDMRKAYELSRNHGDDSLRKLYYENNPIVAGSEGSIQYTIEKVKPYEDSSYEEYCIKAKGSLRDYWQTQGILDWCMLLSKKDESDWDRLEVRFAYIDNEGVEPYIFSRNIFDTEWSCCRIITESDYKEWKKEHKNET